MAMTKGQIETIRALAEASLATAKAAEIMGVHRKTVWGRVARIREMTGKDPMTFHGLTELLEMCDKEAPAAICRVCGKGFEPAHCNSTICSEECRAISTKEARSRHKASLKEIRNYHKKKEAQRKEQRPKPVIPVRLTVFPDLSLEHVNEMAKAAGMSYGKFVAAARGNG